MKPWLIYVRVSTEDQAHGGVSLDAQLAACRAWSTLKGVQVAEEVVDAGHSAKSLKRPGMERVLGMIRDGSVAGVIAWRLDRLTRSIRDLVTLLDLLGETKGLVSASENLDTTSAMGRFVVHLLGAIAQWERETIGDRTSAAMKHAKRSGYFTGGHTPPGCVVEIEGARRRLKPGPDAGAVAAIWPAIISGRSLGQVADDLQSSGLPGSWSAARVWNLLHSSQLCGVLVDEATFTRAIAALDQRSTPMNRTRKGAKPPQRTAERISPLRGLVRCPSCEGSMVQVQARGNGGAYHYFRCHNRPKRKCSQKDIKVEPLEARVISELQRVLDNGDYRKALEAELEPLRGKEGELKGRLAALRAEADQLDAKLGDLATHGPRPGSAAFKALCAPLAARRDAVELELAETQGALGAVTVDQDGVTFALESMSASIGRLKDAPLEHQQKVMRETVWQVVPGQDRTILRLYVPQNTITPAVGEGEGDGSFRTGLWLTRRDANTTNLLSE